ncbi:MULTISPECIES: Fur family transcriptional regulator [Anaerococcus]|uniref:Fur family transcriptional regulator n=1 Tax=Anaerococcus TaxID=165779 RepID=UPI0027B9A577|nr:MULTISPECIES: Fur family transcriptional regulator [Anaerococcus]MDU2558241.1 Fur family transcriptional regulator [Anaerococcus prevotii]MDU2584769.1 Fur family transcriptional regulator [Anaerococcus prevotii]MDU3137401.1 Fur family transcriptional regulator [Anaerococcus prevotii]
MEKIINELRNEEYNQRLPKLRELLAKHNIRVSHQRLLILDYLIMHPTHPTADKIYKDLKKVDPVISQATVYNTLNLLVEHKLVKELDFNMSSKRYEFKKTNHGHFICESCGLIEDLDVDDLEYPEELSDYEIDNVEVIYRGICPVCLHKDN